MGNSEENMDVDIGTQRVKCCANQIVRSSVLS